MLYKFHLSTMNMCEGKKILEQLFSFTLRMLCDFDLLTYMIDYPWTVKMIASLMKAHWANLGILSVDVPDLTTKNLTWSDHIQEDSNK